jgi:hypothetical protein
VFELTDVLVVSVVSFDASLQATNMKTKAGSNTKVFFIKETFYLINK